MESRRDELTIARDQIVAHDAFHALFIDPDDMGNGHGRHLMAHALQNGSKHGGRTLQIQSDPNATKFYEAAGAYQIGLLESGSIPGRQLPLLQIDVHVTGTDVA